jgi:hypoxanthine phosphoribosyltransferase
MTTTPDKLHISARELYTLSFKLARQIVDSGYRPDFLVALWRGGTPVGIVIQEFLQYLNIATDHIAIRTSSYEGINKRSSGIRIHGLDYIVDRISAQNKLLLIDDVYDTGLTMKEIINTLFKRCRANTPEQIKIATLFYKPGNNQTSRSPDFFLSSTDKWIIFPHELAGLSKEEILKNKEPEIADCFK